MNKGNFRTPHATNATILHACKVVTPNCFTFPFALATFGPLMTTTTYKSYTRFSRQAMGIDEFLRQPKWVQEFGASILWVLIQGASIVMYRHPMFSTLKIYKILLECQKWWDKLGWVYLREANHLMKNYYTEEDGDDNKMTNLACHG